jgi:hypothetical protein
VAAYNAGPSAAGPDASLIDDLVGDDDRTDDNGPDPKVYGDSAYSTGESVQARSQRHASGCKTQPPAATGDLFTKDRLNIDLGAGTVTCPNNVTVGIRFGSQRRGPGPGSPIVHQLPVAGPLHNCRRRAVHLARRSRRGIGPHLGASKTPGMGADYRATQSKVGRKLSHLIRRRHGGPIAGVQGGTTKVGADFNPLAAATNLARLAVLGLRSTPNGWAVARA